MNSSKFIYCLTLFLIPFLGFAQSQNECQAIVDLTVEAINTGSIEGIKPHLASNFSIAGQESPIATMVLQQLVGQLNDEIQHVQFSAKEETEKGLKLVYEFEYRDKGVKETLFFFDSDNKLKELELFKMEVKSISKEDTKILKSKEDVIAVPIEMRGKLILVDVLLDGIQRKFILDSGAPKVILNQKYTQVNENDLNRTTISNSKGVNGSVSGLDIIHIEELNFHGISLKDQDVLTLDLSALEKDYEVEIYGLLGFELIKGYDILFDYDKKELLLLSPNYYETFDKEYYLDVAKTSTPIVMEGHIPVVEINVNGKNLAIGLDCGAEVNLISNDLYQDFANNLENISTDTLWGADRVPRKVIAGEVKQTQIGRKYFQNMETVFSDISHINAGYSIKIDGIMGYELFSKQPTLLSFARKELIFYD